MPIIISQWIRGILIGLAVVLNLCIAGLIIFGWGFSGIPSRFSGMAIAFPGLLLWIPTFMSFKFPWGGLITLVLLVTVSISVACISALSCSWKDLTLSGREFGFYATNLVCLSLNLILAKLERHAPS